jgi:competence protein ComEA
VLPTALRGARLRVPRLATIGLLVIVVLAGAGFGLRVAWARAASAPHAVNPPGRADPTAPAVAARQKGSAVVPGSGRAAFTATAGPSAEGGGTSTASPGTVMVHVVGRVVRPGVVRLPAGSRVTDAVARAGGPRPDADLSAINLARVVADGEQVRVPKPGEAPTPLGSAPSAGAGLGPPAAGGAAAASAPVNLNSAGLADLDQLPGVGPVLAQRILDWRTEHQRFASVDELGEVSGIGDKLLAQLRPKVSV